MNVDMRVKYCIKSLDVEILDVKILDIKILTYVTVTSNRCKPVSATITPRPIQPYPNVMKLQQTAA